MKDIYLIATCIIAASIGLLDSLYLLAHWISGAEMSCGLTHGCGIVAASPYSMVFGIPLSVFGIIFYFGFVILLALEQQPRIPVLWKTIRMSPRMCMLVYASIGALLSLYFIFLQAFVIRAWCQYCLLSAFTTLLIFICAAVRFKKPL